MIIGISGRKGAGKDLVGEIFQYYLNTPASLIVGINLPYTLSLPEEVKGPILVKRNGWKIVKFADKLKDMVCTLIGCTREQLEDREFKETPLGEEW